jgi:hypothetical protein
MVMSDLVDQVPDFDKLSMREQVKLMSFFAISISQKDYFTANDVKVEFDALSLSKPANITRDLISLCNSKPPILIKNKDRYAFQRTAKKILEELYLGTTHKRAISLSLRELLNDIKGKEQVAFCEEAISCFEIKAFRAAIIMTWLLTLDVIYEFIISKKLVEFNAAIQAHGKYKKITILDKDQFSDLKESDFIEISRGAKIITNDVRKILVDVLDFRNTCAHPNTISVQETKAISIIEDLINNVIKKFQ